MECYNFYGNAKVDGDTTVGCYAFHGLPNSSLPMTYPIVDPTYDDAQWAAEQLSMATVWPSVNEEYSFHQHDQKSLSNATSDFVADDSKVLDFAYQLPTPPATPSGRDTLLVTKEVASSDMEPDVSSTTNTEATAQEEFIVSDFFTCLEDNQYYYFGDSVGLGHCYDECV
ncbi:hypothetical protein P171DRAFT_209867 [Karstenula rhodostoma CBS 690.94]|uniref:Uncharacterized protein n=1 Tax=Karstenula rhodostoma CBS 690.94 TaxID=1392251 RepID=A0A9P4UDX2_9PLEO|nr:hypothetical protein P171DRAFT_209867 [Karstenula rhodostoma CBS 690.94]